MPKIEINGKTIDAKDGQTIIQVADEHNIAIPRFCYHRKLSVAANCRMCLVEVEKSPKTLPACATPIQEGMKVWTESKEAIISQKSVMEFLLINHPLDCPICDQGGECELQDLSMQYGDDRSRFVENKRVVVDRDLGPLISSDMTRCIQCTRCVRFGIEIAGRPQLGACGRGEVMEITTYVAQNIDSEVSGNIIDLCPVGALTAKPFRFKARAWELTQKSSIAMHDCLGSNIYLHVLNNKVMRAVPKYNDAINESWASDRDRFSYEGLNHDERLRRPMLRQQNCWNIVPWIEALNFATAGIKLTLNNYGPQELAVLATPNSSIEEYYLLQKLTRALGSNNIDHRLRQLDFSNQNLAPQYPNLGIKYAELEHQEVIVLIGCNLSKEQPLAALKLRKAALLGAKIYVINPVDYEFNFAVSGKSIVSAAQMINAVADLLHNNEISEQLKNSKKSHIILGQLVMMHPQFSDFISIAAQLSKLTNCTFGYFSDGANAAGAWLAGCVPHRSVNGEPVTNSGKNAKEMLTKPSRCYIILNVEPEFDSIYGKVARETLKKADFVIALSCYQSETLLDIADVILPVTPFSEHSGTVLNIDGTWQSYIAAVPSFAEARPAWKVLRVLGNQLGLNGFDYVELPEVVAELKAKLKQQDLPTWNLSNKPISKTITPGGVLRLAPIALYASDNIVRRAIALQKTTDAATVPTVVLNRKTAEKLNLSDKQQVKVTTNSGGAQLILQVNDRVADDTALINSANIYTNSLGVAYEPIEVHKC